MRIYLNKDDFKLDNSCILVAPTGTGKTKALIDYVVENQEQCVFVAPLNSIGKQVYERANGYFKLINCETTNTIVGDIHLALSQKQSIIISLTTFIKYRSMFYTYNTYIDECHFIIEYNNLMDTENLANDIRNNKFKKIIGLTATSFGLDKLLKLPLVKPEVQPKSTKHITLNWMKQFNLESFVGTILKIYKTHKKLVVMYNNTKVLYQIQNELNARNINTKIYISEQKDVQIINEKFSNNFDILLCTSALTTGVSINEQYYSVYFYQNCDSINTIPQFFSRNRSKNSQGCIIKRFYNNTIEEIVINEHDFYNKTIINSNFTETINDYLQKIGNNITKDVLNSFVNTSDDYIFDYGMTFEEEIDLLIEQKYLNLIENQQEYFENNIFPRFNIHSYKYLYMIYQIYDIVVHGKLINDDILNKYAEEYQFYNEHFVPNRSDFYIFYFEKVREYKTDIGLNLANQTTYNSINIEKFEEKFLDVPYKKKELKEFCIKEFAIKPEIFKNQKTIDEFLSQLGYVLKYLHKGRVIRKLQ